MNRERVLKDDELLEIRGDRIFHDLWNEHEMDTIEWTVMQILNCSYEDIHGNVKVGNIRIPNLAKNEKQKYLDLIVYYKNEIMVIEMNNNATNNYLRNVLYTMSGVINSYLEGESYSGKKVRGILVNLNWYNEKDKRKNYEPISELVYGYPKIGEEKSDYLIKTINVNLDYFSNICYDKTRKSDKLWKLFTITKKEELDEFIAGEERLINYRNKLYRLSRSEEYCRMIWDERLDTNLRRFQDYSDGEDAGIEKGIQEGVLKKQTEMILNMYKEHVPEETIAKYAGISIDEVKKTINEKTN